MTQAARLSGASGRSNNLSITENRGACGATVTAVDLANLADEDWEAIYAAFLEYAVLVFPAQTLTTESQRAFGSRFGSFEVMNGVDGASRVGNVATDGRLLTEGDGLDLGPIKGNEGWHTDSSFMPVSAKATVLSAHVVPPSGSATEWCDMRAAYNALPRAMQDKISRLAAFHSIEESQRRLGYTRRDGSYGEGLAPPLRPLVKIHPETGRPAIFSGRHAYLVAGLEPNDSAELLDWLIDHSCRTPRVLTHHWSAGDLVLWDNRAVLHRAKPWILSEPRLMIHTRIAGDPTTEGSINPVPRDLT